MSPGRRATPSTSRCGKTILSRSDRVLDVERLDALPPLPRDEEGPVFAEPWQAQAFALAVKLSEQGHFIWKEWAGALAVELKAAADRGEPDDGSRYYPIGSRPSSVSSRRRGWQTLPSSTLAWRRGPMPIVTRRTANRWCSHRRDSAASS